MKTASALIQPQVSLPTGTEPAFDIEDSEDFVGLAEQLMDGHHAAILATVDEDGHPHSRWMGTMSFRDFPRFHALTSPQSAKVRHIERHPDVEWMLANQDLTLIVNLSGKARILRDTASIKQAWKAVDDKSHAYFLHSYNEKPGFVVVETTVERIHCTAPKSDMKWPVSVEAFRRCLPEPTRIDARLPACGGTEDRAPSAAEAICVDEALCQQVEQLATGAEIHESRNLVAAYRDAVGRFRKGDSGMIETVRGASRTLRRMLTRLRLGHYSRLRRIE